MRQINYVFASKLIILALIVLLPFVDYSLISAFDYTVVKVVFLIAIAGLSFYDMQIAVLLTVLFFVLIISSNAALFEKAKSKKEPFIMTEFPAAECPVEIKNTQNENMMSHYLDDKIKPYESYVKMLSDPEHVDNAAGIA